MAYEKLGFEDEQVLEAEHLNHMEEGIEDAVNKSESLVSPIITAEAIEGGHRVTIKDVNGEETIELMHGADGVGIESIRTVKSTSADGVPCYSMTFKLTDGRMENITVYDGAPGKDGTSATVTEVSESTESGGDSVVTFSDGNTLTVKNGKDGKDGSDGKSAYAYAQDVGYSGTEEEFAEKMASEEVFQIVLKVTASGYTADKTYSEIHTAINAGEVCIVMYENLAYFKTLNQTAGEYTFATGLITEGYVRTLTVNSDDEWVIGGYYVPTKEEVDELSDKVENSNSDHIPDYWNEHLSEKIANIKALQEAGGKDCFSFVVLTDIHYEQNLGKKSPVLIKKILDECNIKYCLCLGDSQTRYGVNHETDYIKEEWNNIEEMLLPIRDRLLMQRGNHDGSYSTVDFNENGKVDSAEDESNENCVFNLSPNFLYERIYRKTTLMSDVVFDESGNGFYVDDKNAKVRYILLNSHNNKYELNEDGTAKYNNMNHFRFGQAQFDMVIEALTTIPSDDWSVVVASHVPLDRSGELIAWGAAEVEDWYVQSGGVECWVMQDILSAYAKKEAYAGNFDGTEGTGTVSAYTNLADTNSADWVTDARLNSSGTTSPVSGSITTNFIPCKTGDVLRIKNANVPTTTLPSGDNNRFVFYDENKTVLWNTAVSTFYNSGGFVVGEDGVQTLTKVGSTDGVTVSSAAAGTAYVRFCVTDANNPIITVNEEIVEVAGETYDSVTVDADFTDAKGSLVGYFAGHMHEDKLWDKTYGWHDLKKCAFNTITTRCDGRNENDTTMFNERVAGTTTEQSFDVFTVNKAEGKIYATKVGAGDDREISYKE